LEAGKARTTPGQTGENVQKTNASPRGRGAKSWEVSQREATYLYRIYAPDLAPIANYFVACGGSPAVNHKSVAPPPPTSPTSGSGCGPTKLRFPSALTLRNPCTNAVPIDFHFEIRSIACAFEPTRVAISCTCCLTEQRRKSVHRTAVLRCVRHREFSRRAQKISPAQAGPSQREETPPVQGQFQDIRVGCACYGQLKLAPSCDFWDTVLERPRRSIAVMVF
jgi:hypothetical protein